MNITNIISAIGNNSSVYPLIVRDCGIEVPTKIVMTYNQNKKESKDIAYLAVRERFLDEYSTSAVWLGGIPLIGKLCDFMIKKKGLNPKVNLKLFKEEEFQGINYNIEKFKTLAPDAVKDLIKAKENKRLYEKLLAGKFIASTSIPILFMGFILPKLVFASSAKKIEKMRGEAARNEEGRKVGRLESKSVNEINLSEAQQAQKNDNNLPYYPLAFQPSNNNSLNELSQSPKSENSLSSYLPTFLPSNSSIPPALRLSFTSNWISKTANFSVQDKMAVTDGGYAVGRVTTARNKNESIDLAFKMTGMMFLNFVAPKWIEKGLNRLTGVTLDPVMLADKDFIEQTKNDALKLPKSGAEKDLFEFIDNPANKTSVFVQYANKFGKLKMLESGIRDPREYVDTKKLAQFREDIEKFAKKLKNSNDVKKFVKNAKFSKTVNILTNVGLSSFLLAYALPKCQFAFRKLITGSDLEPGLAPAEKELY